MPRKTEGQVLIDAFFAALKLRRLKECEAILTRLRTLALYAPWCTYFDGVLASERDNDWAEAERIFRGLLQTDLSPSLRGRVLMALGNVCKYQGHWEEAIRAYESTLPLFTRLERPLDRVRAWKQMAIAHHQGYTHGDLGSEALLRAQEHCRRALELLDAIEEPSTDIAWLEGSLWNKLGLIYRDVGRWDEAIRCYRKDLAICRSLDDRFGVGLSYGNLGEVYQKRGRDSWPQALEAYHKALAIIREFDDRYEETEVLANLGFLHQEMGAPDTALAYYEQAIALIEDLRAGLSSEKARAGFFATIADTYANAVLLCLQMNEDKRAFDLVEQARSRAFLDALSARSTELAREMATPTLSLEEVQAALPDDALLLEYFTTGLVETEDVHRPTAHGPERHRFPPPRTLLFAVTSDAIQVHDLSLTPNALRPRQLDSVVERHFLRRRTRRALYERLVGPVEHLLPGKQRLYLVPHGPLHYVPFQALLAPDGETLLREGGPRLSYAPSATLLLSPRFRETARAPCSCLALGYDTRGRVRTHFAEQEADTVARLTAGQALTGPGPKKKIFFERADDYRLVHLSCHGEFDPQKPLSSSLHLGANESLTALEVMERLRLRCDLVTLSACESGLSRVRRGDELVGLVRAFLHAGAPAMVVTLWRVDERSTLILMERFYREIQAGTSFGEALQQAQLYLRNLTLAKARERLGNEDWRLEVGGSELDDERIFADPFHWAPFILIL